MRVKNIVVAATLLLACSLSFAEQAQAGSDDYEKELSRGQRQIVKKDFEAAVASFTEVLRQNPNVYEAYLLRAQARVAIKDMDGALADYDQAIKVNPNVVESYIKRGELQSSQGNQQAAIDDYTQALRLNPKNGSAHMKRAEAYKQNGDFLKAADDYSSFLKFDKNSMEAREARGECRLRAYDYDGALDDFNFLLKKFKTKSFSIHYNLGELYAAKGDMNAAKEHFNEVIAYYSKNLNKSKKAGWDYIRRGRAYYHLGETDKAMSDIESGAAMLPDDPTAQYELGHARLLKGDAEGAIKPLDVAIKANPRLFAAYVDRGSANIALGQFLAAKKDLDTALANEKSTGGYLYRAMARVAYGDAVGAYNDVIEAKKLNPKALEVKQKELSAELAAKEKANDKDPAVAQILEQLALIDLANNNVDSAEASVKKAISIQEKSLGQSDPKIAYSLLLLGKVYLQKQQLPRAEALFRTAMIRLRTNPDGTQKYAVFSLEDCARVLIQSAKQEDAGAILSDTRMARAVSGLTEGAFTGDLARRAESAIDAYKQKKKFDRQEELVRKAAVTPAAEDDGDSTPVEERKRANNRPIRDKWAVIVGIGQFKDPNINLKFASKDAKDFANFLVKDKGFAPDHVQLLTDQQATRANILSLLGSKWLPRVAEPDDLVVIYFSSHGSPSSLDVGGVNYLVAHDTDPNDLYATGIAMQDLARIIKARVHSDRIMLVLDACHSGSVAPSAKGIGREANINVDAIVQGTGQLVLSSSSPEQRSWESKRYDGSVFTKYLIEGLKLNGKMTTLGDAFAYLDQETKREVLRDRGVLQSPIMKSKWEGKDLILGVTPSAPSRGVSDFELPDSVRLSTGTDDGASKSVKPKGPAKKH
ncbi:tetratricopeptide repeat protein [Candidatus Obscuribacterales bacterium]|nr:tetratricopeptide repeat protein [Candidatus Obscuribacterales bacterium]